MKIRLINFALASVLGAALLGGCTPEARDKYDSAGDSAAAAASKTGDAMATDAKKTGEAAAATAENAAEAAKDAADNAAKATDNAAMTGKVKNALISAADLEAAGINVDTVDKTIVLKGSVPSEKQKSQAATIAKGIAGTDYKVDNQLTVSGS